MLQTLLLKFFFYVPKWLLKIFFFKKRKIIRGHQFDAQSAALLSVFPKTNLSILLDTEIAETRKLLNEKRKKK